MHHRESYDAGMHHSWFPYKTCLLEGKTTKPNVFVHGWPASGIIARYILYSGVPNVQKRRGKNQHIPSWKLAGSCLVSTRKAHHRGCPPRCQGGVLPAGWAAPVPRTGTAPPATASLPAAGISGEAFLSTQGASVWCPFQSHVQRSLTAYWC